MKKISLSYVIYCLIAVAILHFWATIAGIYQTQIENGFVWIDNILHLMSGFASGILFLWILEKKNLKYSWINMVILTMIFVFGLAIIWELLEFGILRFFTSYAHSLYLYSSSIAEAFSDIVSNTAGGIVLLLFIRKYYKE